MTKKPRPPGWRVLQGGLARRAVEAPPPGEEAELTPGQLAALLLEYVLDQPLGSPHTALLYAVVYCLQGQCAIGEEATP